MNDQPGRLRPVDDDLAWELLDPDALMGDGSFREANDSESLLHDNRIRAACALRMLRSHVTEADNAEQAVVDVVTNFLHLADLLGLDPDWLEDARAHHEGEIAGRL